jgi:hypothetical protein
VLYASLFNIIQPFDAKTNVVLIASLNKINTIGLPEVLNRVMEPHQQQQKKNVLQGYYLKSGVMQV